MIKKRFNKKINKILIWYCIKGTPSTSDVRGSLASKILKQIKRLYNNQKLTSLINMSPSMTQKKLVKVQNFSELFKSKRKIPNYPDSNNNHYWKDIGYKKLSKKLLKNGIIYDFWSSFNKVKYKKITFVLVVEICNN